MSFQLSCQIAKHKMTPTLAGMSWNVNSLSFFNSTSMCRARCMPSISSTCGPLQKPTSSLILQKFSQRSVLVNDVSIKNRPLSEKTFQERAQKLEAMSRTYEDKLAQDLLGNGVKRGNSLDRISHRKSVAIISWAASLFLPKLPVGELDILWELDELKLKERKESDIPP